jgi:hypothetical protein
MAQATNILRTTSRESSRRDILASVALGLVGLGGSASMVFRPTELGRTLLQRLPAYRCASDGETMDAAYDSCEEVLDAIAQRPITSVNHLVDAAIAATFMAEHGVYDDIHHERIVAALLSFADIQANACAL